MKKSYISEQNCKIQMKFERNHMNCKQASWNVKVRQLKMVVEPSWYGHLVLTLEYELKTKGIVLSLIHR